jgi:acyl-CoA synthetase (NDP forming)
MAIESLLKPRSIAIVGASDKIGPGFNAWQALQFVGFEGPVYLVNPNKSELFGRKSYSSLSDIEADEIDAVFAAVRTESTIDVMTQAVTKRVGAVTVLSSGFGDAGEAGARVQRELADIAIRNDIAVCGPNCLGLLNFSGRSAMFGTSLPESVSRGGIAAIVQSGSIGIALLNSGRQLGLSHLVTSGNEAVTATADYLEAFIDDPAVETIIVFSEQIRKPAKFITMARRARACGKPLIVLKSGRSEKGRAAVMAHTGAVAGSVEACDAALEDSGAIQVHTLDELLETAALASRIRRMPTARKIAAVSLSGGEIALALDAAEDNGIVFAAVDTAHDQIKSLLPEFAHISNPLDLTWAGLYDAGVAEGCASALAGMTDVGALVLLQDAPSGLGPQQAARYANLLRSVARGAEHAGKPLIAVSNLSDEPHSELGRAASETGVPYLRGTREGLSAIARLSTWATRPACSMSPPTPASVLGTTREALQRLGSDRLPAEHEARQVLSAYGVRGPSERFVSDVDEAVVAALELGFPVALKGVAEGLVHKTEAGLVKLRLASVDDVRRAASSMFESGGSGDRHAEGRLLGVLVQKMMSPIAELLVGARVDPDFGPLIVMGGGGVTVELYRDVAIRLAPVSPEEALAAISSTRAARLLDGWRGAPVCDRIALGETISALSRFVSDFSETVSEVEINPLAVFAEGQGCMALDCVIVPSRNP